MAREELEEPLKIEDVTHASLNELQRKLTSLNSGVAAEAIKHAADLRVLLGKQAMMKQENSTNPKYKRLKEAREIEPSIKESITEKTKKLREALEKINRLNQSV